MCVDERALGFGGLNAFVHVGMTRVGKAEDLHIASPENVRVVACQQTEADRSYAICDAMKFTAISFKTVVPGSVTFRLLLG